MRTAYLGLYDACLLFRGKRTGVGQAKFVWIHHDRHDAPQQAAFDHVTSTFGEAQQYDAGRPTALQFEGQCEMSVMARSRRPAHALGTSAIEGKAEVS